MKAKWPKPSREFNVPIYGGRCYLYRSQIEYNEAREFLGRQPVTGIRAGAAVHLEQSKTGESVHLIGWFNRDVSTLVHEVGHTALHVLEHAGIEPASGNGEPYCYLLDTLFSLCYGKDGRP